VVEPDFGRIHLALRRKGVTLTLLWEEYRAANEGRRTWGLTQFCEHYKTYSKTLCRSMRHLGGVPQMIVPDNARALIADPNRYEPRANDTVLDFARHHDVTILPARPYRPQDKAKVESAVQVVERRLECIGDLADGVASAQSAYTGQLTLPRASRDL
jgi:transposase